MYPLMPYKVWTIALAFFFAMAVLVNRLSERLNWEVGLWRLASIATMVTVTVLILSFGKHWYWSPWRCLWRRLPQLNQWVYPDLNGVWVGATSSNWPTIQKMFNAAQCSNILAASDLQETAEREDNIVIEIQASLFRVKIEAYLGSTKGKSHSITARPFRTLHNGDVHLVYVYSQDVPDPDVTDECTHLGAAELVFPEHAIGSGEGIYWTRRKWKLGLNTAGKIQIERVSGNRATGKTLASYLRLETHPR